MSYLIFGYYISISTNNILMNTSTFITKSLFTALQHGYNAPLQDSTLKFRAKILESTGY